MTLYAKVFTEFCDDYGFRWEVRGLLCPAVPEVPGSLGDRGEPAEPAHVEDVQIRGCGSVALNGQSAEWLDLEDTNLSEVEIDNIQSKMIEEAAS